MKGKNADGRRARLLPLSIICSCLLVALIIHQNKPHATADGDSQWKRAGASALSTEGSGSMGSASVGNGLEYAQILSDNRNEASSYQRLGYSQAIGKQHEQRRKREDAIGSNPVAGQASQYDSDNQAKEANIAQDGPMINVRLSDSDQLEQIPIEQYVLGVTLAELPGSFEPEAIKAQMLAARTYIVHRLLMQDEGLQDGVYEVSDTTADQVYMSLDKIQQYKQDYPDYYKKFVDSLKQTEGLIISYNDQPIDAVFFSTSNGFTEDAEQLWGQQVSYLQSVASPWDQEVSPKYETTYQFTFSELYEKLNLKQSRRNGKLNIANVTKNDSGRVTELTLNGASFTGRELREKLELASTAMTWKIDEKQEIVSFVCYGYGHGVGLSQWGANGMALEGYLVEDIVKHYYSGVEIVQASKFVNKI